MRRKNVDEVFTPRNQSVNSVMYIDRESDEKRLFRSVSGTMHSFLFGESGSGKSWLYKKVFEEKKVNYITVNAANVSRSGTLVGEIYSKCFQDLKAQKTSYVETKKVGFNAGGTGELSHAAEYIVTRQDALLDCYRHLSKKARGASTVIVLDNVETIFEKTELMSELTDVLILLDDEDYAVFNVKFLLIAVPHDVLQYFSHAKNPSSVGNRINELPRITGLKLGQVHDFVERGFINSLKVAIPEVEHRKIARHIYTVTLGIPQRIHEYCECLAYQIEDNNWGFDPSLIKKADHDWLQKGLRNCYSVVQGFLNSDETVDGRRNQVIFALGRVSTHQIDTSGISAVISQDFPSSSLSNNSGIGQVLAHLSKGDNPILKRLKKSTSYSFSDPRYIMCIRLILYIEAGTEKVKKRNFTLN